MKSIFFYTVMHAEILLHQEGVMQQPKVHMYH